MKKTITIMLLALMLLQLGSLLAVAAESPKGEADAGTLYTFSGKLLKDHDQWILQLQSKQKLELALPDDDFMLEEYNLKLVKFDFIEVTGYFDEERFIVTIVVKDGTAYEF